jgi:hypothetical protein
MIFPVSGLSFVAVGLVVLVVTVLGADPCGITAGRMLVAAGMVVAEADGLGAATIGSAVR